MIHDLPDTLPALPAVFEACRVSDALMARAYARTGDRGRALIKSCVAALFQAARLADTAAVTTTTRFFSGLALSEELTPRPWFAVVLGPGVASPAQLVAALMPAVARRIPLVMAFRPKARGGWPFAQLTALELCGVEQVFAPSFENFKFCLDFLKSDHGCGGLVCLGLKPFWERVRAIIPDGCPAHWLAPPESAALFAGPGIAWDRDALEFSHAGLRIQEFKDPIALSREGHGVVFSPASSAPASARLVLEPGREALWDWPEAPRDLFFARRLVYC